MPTDFSTAALRKQAAKALDENPAALTQGEGNDAPAEPAHRSHTPMHAMLAAMGGGQVADAMSTRKAIREGRGAEGNPIYGSDPSMARLLATKAAIAAPVGYALDKAYDKHPKLSMALAGLATAAGFGLAAHNNGVGKK